MTQEAKHTPGPWIHAEGVASTHDTYVADIVLVDTGDYRGQICRLQSCEHIAGISIEETKANADLIASAPETAAERDRLKESNAAMLEALKYQEMADADPEAARRKGYYDEARKLRKAALAKVEAI